MKRFTLAMLSIFVCAVSAAAQEMPADYKKVVEVLGRGGDFKAGVLKVNVPRGMQVQVAGIALPMAFGFSGYGFCSVAAIGTWRNPMGGLGFA